VSSTRFPNAKTGPGTAYPSVMVHNFTSLEFPQSLPSGLRLVVKPAESLKDIYPFSILVVTPDSLERDKDYDFLFQHVGVMLWDPAGSMGPVPPPWVDIKLSPAPSNEELRLACNHMLRLLELKEHCLTLHNSYAITEARNQQLNQIGVALMSERNLDSLLDLILDKAMTLTGSDAGCLYLVEAKAGAEENPEDYWANKQVRFKLTRNRSVEFNFAETVVWASKSSIVGYTLLEGKPLNIQDVYSLDPKAQFRHNNGFDKSSGYRTRSMLTLPMKGNHDQVIGAIQLINKCRIKLRPITSMEAADEQVVPYRQDDLNVSLSLASQASVAILNAQYERDIKNLFEGFIKASVTAIESRDPTTSGHSNRVASYCVRLADCLGRESSGSYKGATFNDMQLRELRYAALLHDFGKIGVREHILTKSKKLFPDELEAVRQRVDFIKRTVNWQIAEAKVRILKEGREPDPEAAFARLEAEERLKLEEADEFFEKVRKSNEPARMTEETTQWLRQMAEKTYADFSGAQRGYLNEWELSRLSIPSGTLSAEERMEIQNHVTHTFKFLSAIPWTQDLRQVPLIAYAHHEKLDGTGYPRRLPERDIPLPSKIMTVCDIYDALAAADRPYKKALPPEKALDIISAEVKTGKIDPELFQVFIDAKVYLINP
jgi:HD-GYP domain-containing protein (c-di-GMP phosphodiesterase class II)